MINTYKARLTRARKHAKNGNVEACADELLKANREKESCSELRKAQWLLEACEKECRRVLGITTPLFAGVEEENTGQALGRPLVYRLCSQLSQQQK